MGIERNSTFFEILQFHNYAVLPMALANSTHSVNAKRKKLKMFIQLNYLHVDNSTNIIASSNFLRSIYQMYDV